MQCDELKSLKDACLDSELETGTTVEIERHLKSCPECARYMAVEQKLESRLRSALNRGEATALLWTRIEKGLRSAGRDREGATVRLRHSDGRATCSALFNRIRAGWRLSPAAWTSLAAAWVIIFALNGAARDERPALTAGSGVPSLSDIRLAWEQKQMLLVELAVSPEPPSSGATKPPPTGPRSEREKAKLNT